MNVKKFTAPTSREALHKLREAMGPDAVIISSRNVQGRVEILALAESDMADLNKFSDDVEINHFDGPGDEIKVDVKNETKRETRHETKRETKHEAKHETQFREEVNVNADVKNVKTNVAGQVSAAKNLALNPIIQSQAKLAKRRRQSEGAHAAHESTFKPAREDACEIAHETRSKTALTAQNRTQDESAVVPDEVNVVALMSELRSMRSMMESQLAEISWGNTQRKEPHKAQLLKEMLSTGFSAGLARHLIDHLPRAGTAEQDKEWIKAILSKNIATISCDSDMLEKGGVFALVGPTGVGKTTTTAKLAARCVMRHGASKLALITTDGYRIGGYEQLRIYGKILGVMVHAVKDETDLQIALSELENKHTVLIDTVGMSQRDRLVSEQVAMLSGANVNKLLCLNATSTGETLCEVIHSYKGSGLSGCIITKMDEAASLGAVLDAIIRHKLNLYYLANGQRVPEDLHVANKNYLVDLAFKLKRDPQAFQFFDDELPMLMGNVKGSVKISSVANNEAHLSEVSLGKL